MGDISVCVRSPLRTDESDDKAQGNEGDEHSSDKVRKKFDGPELCDATDHTRTGALRSDSTIQTLLRWRKAGCARDAAGHST